MTWRQGDGILRLSSSAPFYHQSTEATVRLQGSTFHPLPAPLPCSGCGHVTPSLGLGFLICKMGTWEPSKTTMGSIPRTEWILPTYYFYFIMKNTSCSQQTEEGQPRSSPSTFWRHRGPGQESPAPHRSKAVLSHSKDTLAHLRLTSQMRTCSERWGDMPKLTQESHACATLDSWPSQPASFQNPPPDFQ